MVGQNVQPAQSSFHAEYFENIHSAREYFDIHNFLKAHFERLLLNLLNSWPVFNILNNFKYDFKTPAERGSFKSDKGRTANLLKCL